MKACTLGGVRSLVHPPGVGVRVGQRKLVLLLIPVKGKREGKDVVVAVLRRLVVVNIRLRNSLPEDKHQTGWGFRLFDQPFWSGGAPDDRCETEREQVAGLAEVDNIKDDPLVHMDIVHREVEPEPEG